MRKYLLLHILIISFVFLLEPIAHVASYAGEIVFHKEEVRKNPDDASAHLNLGVAYGELGKYEDVIRSYKQAISIDPDDAEAHFRLGLTYLVLNDISSALDQYKILKKLDTEKANLLFNLIEHDGRK